MIGAAEEIAAILAGTSGTRIVADEPAATGADATAEPATDAVLFAVNGTLMRGLKLNPNMVGAGATFVREAATEPAYRLWTIDDDHPAMVRVTDGSGVGGGRRGVVGAARRDWPGILLNEPAGLSIGKVRLDDGSVVLGVIGEPALVEGHRGDHRLRRLAGLCRRAGATVVT